MITEAIPANLLIPVLKLSHFLSLDLVELPSFLLFLKLSQPELSLQSVDHIKSPKLNFLPNY